MLINRWQTRGGKYWYELYKDDQGFTYKSDNGGGNLGNITEYQAYTQILDKMAFDDRKYKIQNESENANRYQLAFEKTRLTSLDDRVSILEDIIERLNIKGVLEANSRVDEIYTQLENMGYLPMMFQAAARVWASRNRRHES